jgi:hypothetical protein
MSTLAIIAIMTHLSYARLFGIIDSYVDYFQYLHYQKQTLGSATFYRLNHSKRKWFLVHYDHLFLRWYPYLRCKRYDKQAILTEYQSSISTADPLQSNSRMLNKHRGNQGKLTDMFALYHKN